MTTESITQMPQRTRFSLSLWHVCMLFVVIGILVAGYLSYVKLVDVPLVCIENGPFNCDLVQNSAYSRLFGIPIAWLGLAVYLILGAILLLENRIAFLGDYGKLIFLGINLFAWVFSIWLVYVQFVILQALCQWCLTHEVNITLLLIASGIRFWRDFQNAESN